MFQLIWHISKPKQEYPHCYFSLGEDIGKKEPLYTAGGNASWCNHSEKKLGGFLKI
jgi:hypothetical protein